MLEARARTRQRASRNSEGKGESQGRAVRSRARVRAVSETEIESEGESPEAMARREIQREAGEEGGFRAGGGGKKEKGFWGRGKLYFKKIYKNKNNN